jgi:hypothetical protein
MRRRQRKKLASWCCPQVQAGVWAMAVAAAACRALGIADCRLLGADRNANAGRGVSVITQAQLVAGFLILTAPVTASLVIALCQINWRV